MEDTPVMSWKLWSYVALVVGLHTCLVLVADAWWQAGGNGRPAVSQVVADTVSPGTEGTYAGVRRDAAASVAEAVCSFGTIAAVGSTGGRAARYTGRPNGIVANPSSAFVIVGTTSSAPARFLFSAGDGLIAAWSGSVDFSHALVAVDASASRAVYKGLALAYGGASSLLYAADFHNSRVDVFDAGFNRIRTPGGFLDPGMPAGYAPFGIDVIAGDIYVAYAMQDAARREDVRGPGHGFIDVFDPNGRLVRRLASNGPLNSPWRMAVGPAGGPLAGMLLVGNIGDGLIHAYELATGKLVGQVDPNSRAGLSVRREGPASDGARPEWVPGAPSRLPDIRDPAGASPRRARLMSEIDTGRPRSGVA